MTYKHMYLLKSGRIIELPHFIVRWLDPARRQLRYEPGAHTWFGTEGGTERVIFQTGTDLRVYLSIKAFGYRVRLFGRKPFTRFLHA